MFISAYSENTTSGDTFKLNGRDGYKKVNGLFIYL
ncbi:tRNA lysidine(34) synthetase TilS [Staphylococcus aureus]